MECQNLDQEPCTKISGCEYNFDSNSSTGACEKIPDRLISMARSGTMVDDVVKYLVNHTDMKKSSVVELHQESVLLFETLLEHSVDMRHAVIMNDEDFGKWSKEFIKQITSEIPSSSVSIEELEYLKSVEDYNKEKKRILQQRKERDRKIAEPRNCERPNERPPGLEIFSVPFDKEQSFNGNRFTVRDGGMIEYWSEKQSNFSNLTYLLRNIVFKTFFKAWSPKSAAIASSIIGGSVVTRDPEDGMYNDAIVIFVILIFSLLMSFRIKYKSEINRRTIGTAESNLSTGYPVMKRNKWFN